MQLFRIGFALGVVGRFLYDIYEKVEHGAFHGFGVEFDPEYHEEGDGEYLPDDRDPDQD